MAPNGKRIGSRGAVIEHLEREGAPPDDIELVRRGLKTDDDDDNDDYNNYNDDDDDDNDDNDDDNDDNDDDNDDNNGNDYDNDAGEEGFQQLQGQGQPEV